MTKGISTAWRLSIGLASITMFMLFAAQQVGLVPDPIRQVLQGRAKLCETIAVQFSIAARNNQIKIIHAAAPELVKRNQDILSIAVTDPNGKPLVQTERHQDIWNAMTEEPSVATHVAIPFFKGDKLQGITQICFRPISLKGISALLARPGVRLAFFLALVGMPVYWLYLRKTFRYLDPSKVIPGRVKAILDTLSEGVLVLDNNEQIILANDAFTKATGRSASQLQGQKASKIAWTQPDADGLPLVYPWVQAVCKGKSFKSFPLTLQTSSGQVRTFMVNSGPIRGTDGKVRGALATFDDVSEIEEKNTKLEDTLTQLNESRDEIRQQNKELKLLSTQDPLTSCLNRRAFFTRFEEEWSGASRYGHSLGCVMIDIDHFKMVNDEHGHSTGDTVLKQVSATLKSAIRKSDILCRYGGEEFCVLLPHTDAKNTHQAAEQIRQKIEALMPAGLSITASFGVSTRELGADSPQKLIDQADQALYAAKNSRRNRVIGWDHMPEIKVDPNADTAEHKPAEHPKESEHAVNIPFSAVAALMAALEHRDVTTAVHSRSVADLCVAMAKGLMSEIECFILEVAGLLHDIGKLGVPDSILLKPGPLTKEEWKVMETHDRMGVEIINASFGSTELTNIVRYSHAWYGGNPKEPGLPKGQDIPLRSRMVLIADAFDAMITDRVYRKAMNPEDAMAELRRCAGTQFDPELVERFIETVSARHAHRSTPPLSASQAQALRIGLEIERLACAMEAHDTALLESLASHLAANAAKLGLQDIADVAATLHHSIESDKDTVELMEYTNELLNLCRSHQSSCVSTPDSSTQPQEHN